MNGKVWIRNCIQGIKTNLDPKQWINWCVQHEALKCFLIVQAQAEAVHEFWGGVRGGPEGGERVPGAAEEEGLWDGGGEPARARQHSWRSHHHQAGRAAPPLPTQFKSVVRIRDILRIRMRIRIRILGYVPFTN